MNYQLAISHTQIIECRSLFNSELEMQESFEKLSLLYGFYEHSVIQGTEIVCSTQSWYSQSQLTPVVFLASHTTNQSLNDSFFFSEEKGKIHRFWKVLNNLGVVNIYFQENQEIETLKQNIISGFSNQHNTKYSVSIDCFFSLPCDSVATLKNIFGDSAFVNLCQLSKESFLERLKANTSRKPVIITFQKDVFTYFSSAELLRQTVLEGV